MNSDNLSLYRIFLSVAKAGSILLASEQLFISQPAVSKSIKKLESNLGTRLFIRSSKGVELTDDGRILYDRISSAFEYISLGENAILKRTSMGIGHIRIGVSSTLCKYVLLPFLSEYTKMNPHISISIECQSSAATKKLLLANKIDIGLIARQEDSSELFLHTLGSIHDVFAATPDYLHNMMARSNSDMAFPYANLMVLNRENMTRKYIEQYVPADFFYKYNLLEADSMDLLIDFARTGIGIGCVIKEFIKKELEANILTEYTENLISIPARQVCFATLSDKKSSPYTEDFLDFVVLAASDKNINVLH